MGLKGSTPASEAVCRSAAAGAVVQAACRRNGNCHLAVLLLLLRGCRLLLWLVLPWHLLLLLLVVR